MKLSAQVNLVPNPSFEDYDTCPYRNFDPGGIYYATPWFQPDTCMGNVINSSSSDYYNACTNSSWYDVPSNINGFQFARTGSAYAGIAFYDKWNWPEFLEVKLNSVLVANELYCVEFFVALAGTGPNAYFYSTDVIQAGFTDSIIYTNCGSVPSLIPAILNPVGNIIRDTSNWTRVFGLYRARGGEQFLIIGGDFYPRSNIQIDSTGNTLGVAYYYVDDVAVAACPTSPIIPNVFSPNGDGVNDHFIIDAPSLSDFSCKIYNRWGFLVADFNKDDGSWDGKYGGNECFEGVYYYTISGLRYDENECEYKGFVQLLR